MVRVESLKQLQTIFKKEKREGKNIRCLRSCQSCPNGITMRILEKAEADFNNFK